MQKLWEMMQRLWQEAPGEAGGEAGGGEGEAGGGEGGGDEAAPSLFRPAPEGGEDEEAEEVDDEAPVVDAQAPVDPREAELQKRDAELVERQRQIQGAYQQLQPMIQAQQMLQQGNRAGAMKALGLDPRELIADQYGEHFLPAQEPPSPEEQIGALEKKHSSTKEEISDLREQLARSELRGDMRDILDSAEDLPVMKLMAGKGKQVFYNGMIDAALNVQKQTGKFPEFQDLLQQQEAAYKQNWTRDAAEVLQIPQILDGLLELPEVRSALETRLKAKPSKGKKPAAAAPAPAARRELPDEPPPASLTNDLLDEPPSVVNQAPLKSREDKKKAAVDALVAARKRKEQQGG